MSNAPVLTGRRVLWSFMLPWVAAFTLPAIYALALVLLRYRVLPSMASVAFFLVAWVFFVVPSVPCGLGLLVWRWTLIAAAVDLGGYFYPAYSVAAGIIWSSAAAFGTWYLIVRAASEWKVDHALNPVLYVIMAGGYWVVPLLGAAAGGLGGLSAWRSARRARASSGA